MLKNSLITLAVLSLTPFPAASAETVLGSTDQGETVTSQEYSQNKKDRILPEEFGEAFLQGHYFKIYQQTSESFRQNVSFADFKSLGTSFNWGVTTYELKTSFRINKHQTRYVWVNGEASKGIQLVFDKHGTIQELYLTPLVSYPETDHIYTSNTYTMPIKEEWFVFWGGTNQLINYHYVYENQRYAYDLVRKKHGSTHHGTPTKNKHFYAFGEEVAAPADGRVLQVVDGIKDNVPGKRNTEQPLGNYVIVAHDNGEYSLLAHFKQGSIEVDPGDRVERGELLGLCGNSGNSSEPHIHFQVMDSPDVFEGSAIRIRFQQRTSPIQGEFVEPID
ncbi:M23 family metallopeptidase [Thalassobacillus pellis]|uniref:M23 family metallopeptidase n=1 Tax=Thalassobacillus pellis TaxID=748008 RepID=UPI001EF92146|nr:M23 family metallopeptidase [Thalassobacillus pellis]MBM7551245.1 hypothetical protein [Thalassobacillus pellis]